MQSEGQQGQKRTEGISGEGVAAHVNPVQARKCQPLPVKCQLPSREELIVWSVKAAGMDAQGQLVEINIAR